jgi:hypothetical protein
MINVGKTHDTVRVVNDQIGTPTYTVDLARLLADMIETEKYGYYHATNEGGYISWYDFCVEFYEQYGLTTTIIPASTEAAATFDGRELAGFAADKVFDDAYLSVKITVQPGKHTITLANAAEFDVPAWLEGDFDLDLVTSGDFEKLVKTTYMLKIYAPGSSTYTLSTRRSKLSTASGWETQGQFFYSGAVSYDLGEDTAVEGEFLELPEFCGTAELFIDGKSVGKRAFAPYRFPLEQGTHKLELRCWNSMGNRMERYATRSGLNVPPEKRR